MYMQSSKTPGSALHHTLYGSYGINLTERLIAISDSVCTFKSVKMACNRDNKHIDKKRLNLLTVIVNDSDDGR